MRRLVLAGALALLACARPPTPAASTPPPAPATAPAPAPVSAETVPAVPTEPATPPPASTPPVAEDGEPPQPAASLPPADRPATFVARAGPIPAYDRKEWKHWIDADGDCQDTRQEVLIAESEVPVSFKDARHCKVATGRWTCPYTGKVFTDPGQLDVDHMVPLENAHASGGWAWNAARKEAYANDLDDPEHLVAVYRGANRSKGSKGPDRWMPPNQAEGCSYVADWFKIKGRWGLGMTDGERQKVGEVAQGCP